MSNLKDVAPQAISAAEIVHRGKEMVLPDGMDIDQAIDLLRRRKDYLEQEITIAEVMPCLPYDGAAALARVLERIYGWAPATATPGMFGPTPPKTVNVPNGVGTTLPVVWGRFVLPNNPGFLQTDSDYDKGMWKFQLHASTKRSHENEVRNIFAEIRKEVQKHSIYRGKALRVAFRDSSGDIQHPDIDFMDTDIDPNSLIFSDLVAQQIDTNLFTPIDRSQDLASNGLPFKRGVLLGGPFGTGKTLAARVAAKKAIDQKMTFIYIPTTAELADAVAFARNYHESAAVIFCEDIDREMSGERTEQMDAILNIIDGIDSKSSRIMIVLTTNDLPAINPAMLRPGRLDAVIEVLPPDAEAVQKLLRFYGSTAILPEEDLTDAGVILAGQIPAVIAEVVRRAKLAQLRRQPAGTRVTKLSGEAVAEAAHSIKNQAALLTPKPVAEKPTLDAAFSELLGITPEERQARAMDSARIKHGATKAGEAATLSMQGIRTTKEVMSAVGITKDVVDSTYANTQKLLRK